MKKITSNAIKQSYRQDVLKFAMEQYYTEPEYLWLSLPEYAVLRHSDNKKWYGIIMNVPRQKLGLSGNGIVDILDVKCDPLLGGSLRMTAGFLPAYHMHHENWITILLDGTVEKDMIFSLLEMSFELTASRQTKKEITTCLKKEWIVPVNPKYYDINKAFSQNDSILWKQSNHISVGDIVYLYIAAPVSSILYKCEAIEVDIPYNYDDGKVHMSQVMRLKLIEKYEPTLLTLEKLKEHGIFAVRGPRHMPNSLLCEIRNLHYE